MPGFPLVNSSNADALNFGSNQAHSSIDSQRHFCDLERMPLHQSADQNNFQRNYTDLAIHPLRSQIFNDSTPCFAKSQTPSKDSSCHSGTQLAPASNGSADSEHDLAAMVHDFMESGSFGSDLPESSDGENGLPVNSSRFCESLQALKFNTSSFDRELLSVLSVFFLSVKDVDSFCLSSGTECKGACIRHMLVKHLRCLGYDAAVCSSKWPNSGKVPGGEYEYIDLFFTGEGNTTERLIVDLDFQSQFEIARPTNSYAAALKFLPIVFIGSVNKLQQVLQIMAEAVKMSLKQNSMPLPPWRTFEYMVAKWLSPFERSVAEHVSGALSRQDNCSLADRGGRKQCVEQLNNLKICMVSELDKSHVQKPMNSEKNRRMCFGSRRLSTSGFAVS